MVKKVFLLFAVLALAVVYGMFNPEAWPWFPTCPFYALSGYKCVGCGSQRALHHLLHGRVGQAWQYNPALLLALPYMLLGWYFDYKPNLKPQQLIWRKRLYGTKAIWVVFALIMAYWLLRNLWGW